MTSASFTIDGVLPVGPQLLVPSETPVALALVDAAGAVDVEWSFVGASEADYSYPAITVTGRGTATFPLPEEPAHGFGLTLLLQCRNGGQVARALVCVGSTTQIATGESTERGPQGWSPQMNANFRDAAGPTGATGATGPTGPAWDAESTALDTSIVAATLSYSATTGGDLNGYKFIRATLASTNCTLTLLNAGATHGNRLTIVVLATGAYALTVKNNAGTTLAIVIESQSPCVLEYIYLTGSGWVKIRRTDTAYTP